MDGYISKINELSKKISELEKEIVLKINTTQAEAALAKVKADYDAIKDKTVTITIEEDYQGGGGGGGGDITTSGGTDSSGAITGGTNYGYHALGDVFYHGEIVPFSDGDIVNGPTYFPMPNGIGLMGERGPEAIMPLTRTSDGKLGVKAES